MWITSRYSMSHFSSFVYNGRIFLSRCQQIENLRGESTLRLTFNIFNIINIFIIFNIFNIQHIENFRRESTQRLMFAAAPPSIARGERTAVLLPGERRTIFLIKQKKSINKNNFKRFGSRECQAGEGDCSRDSDCSGTLVFGGNCLTCWFSMFYILLYVDFLCFILFNIVFSGTLQLQCLQTTIAVSCIYKDE